MLLEENGSEWIRWFETHKRTFTLSRTPFSIAEEFQRLVLERDATWVFTSATLSVSGRFDHFKSIMGLEDTTGAVWDSPFDYEDQALFYHPRNLPEPGSVKYTEHLVETVVPILNASKGRAFFLFTSHRVLRLAADLLDPLIDYPMLVQGSQPRMTLLEQFRTLGNAVLLGTTSFWQGVDVKGEALSCVIIDKLPFASPGDPVMKARLDSLRHRGENPFAAFQLPMAVLALKQGVGRLIRDRDDRGVFVLCDPRLLKRSYGRIFLDSLPPMRRTRSIEDVVSFFCLNSCRGPR
jgi:ATP-dependent DNA helicase DinG